MDIYNYIFLIHLVFDLLKFYIVLYVMDKIVLKIFIIKEARYYFLHFLFNLWVIWNTFEDTFDVFSMYSWDGDMDSKTCSYVLLIIMIFHFHHALYSSKSLSKSDWIHHTISAGFVPIAVITLYTNQKAVNCSNFFMIGLPGCCDYFLLFLTKYGIINKITEKRLNCFLNLSLRLPGNFYAGVVALSYELTQPHPIMILCIICLSSLTHHINATYYSDLVVGSYYRHRTIVAGKQT